MKFLLVIFLFPLQLFAQDITGVWTGTLYNDTTKEYIRYELAISEYNGVLSGYSHTIFVIDSVENVGVKSIKVSKAGEKFLVEDDKLIYNNYTEPPAKGVKTHSELILSQNDSMMVLSGTWNTNRTKVYKKLTGSISLQKKGKIKESPLMAKLENLGLTHSLSFMAHTELAKDPGSIKTPNFNSSRLTPPADTARDVALNSALLAKTGNQPLNKTTTETALQKEDIVNEKPPLKVTQMVAAGKTNQNEPGAGSILPGNLPVKDESSVTNKQQASGEESPRLGLKRGDSTVAKEKLGSQPPSKVEKPALKNDSTKSLAVKSDSKQKEKPENTGKEFYDTVLKKAETTIRTGKVKEVASVNVIKPAVGSGNIVSKTPETQIHKQPDTPGVMVVKKDTGDGFVAVAKPVSLAAAQVASRKIEAIRTVSIKSDSLLLTLYDNGEVDGDTVSVLLNGKLIMPMEGLSLKAINKTVYLTPEMGDSIVLIMYAENLGSIPPNTGLLVIHDGDDVYEIRFTGDLEKNSSIILKRKEKYKQY